MKKAIISIFLTFLVSISNIQAQTDTLALMQSIVTNKTTYIGQSFSTLLGQLPIQLKYFFPAAGLPRSRNSETATSFSFRFPNSINQVNYPKLRICWQPYLNRSTSLYLFRQGNGAWSSSAASFYGSAIISDISIEY